MAQSRNVSTQHLSLDSMNEGIVTSIPLQVQTPVVSIHRPGRPQSVILPTSSSFEDHNRSLRRHAHLPLHVRQEVHQGDTPIHQFTWSVDPSASGCVIRHLAPKYLGYHETSGFDASRGLCWFGRRHDKFKRASCVRTGRRSESALLFKG
jgi:hypothetical protein